LSGEIQDIYAWVEPTRRRIQSTKDPNLFFRVRMITPNGTYYSHVVTPHGDLDRREYLIVQDLMRRIVLEQQYLAGVCIKLYSKAAWGAPCTDCRDPISGAITNPDCDQCFGTGRAPGYHGPYEIYGTFSAQQRDKSQKPDGPAQQYTRQLRLVGFPAVKDDDIVVDPADDKRYIVDGVQHETEIRKIPVVQRANVHELPTSDPAFKIGD
jgi:hypothetical protein